MRLAKGKKQTSNKVPPRRTSWRQNRHSTKHLILYVPYDANHHFREDIHLSCQGVILGVPFATQNPLPPLFVLCVA